jgi:preprotein translocase subunit Sec63
MPFINTNPQQKEEKYRFVDEILSAPDYYRVLGIKKDAPTEEIRRAYIRVKYIKSSLKGSFGSNTCY